MHLPFRAILESLPEGDEDENDKNDVLGDVDSTRADKQKGVDYVDDSDDGGE